MGKWKLLQNASRATSNPRKGESAPQLNGESSHGADPSDIDLLGPRALKRKKQHLFVADIGVGDEGEFWNPLEAKIARLEKQVGNGLEQLDDMKTRLQLSETREKQLKAEAEDLYSQLVQERKASEESAEAARAQLLQAVKATKEAEESAKKIEEDYGKVQALCLHLEEEIHDLREKNTRLAEEGLTARSEIDSVLQRAGGAESTLSEEKKKHAADRARWAKEKTAMHTQVERAENVSASLRKERDRFLADIKTKEDEVAVTRSGLRKAQHRIKDLDAALVELRNHVAALESSHPAPPPPSPAALAALSPAPARHREAGAPLTDSESEGEREGEGVGSAGVVTAGHGKDDHKKSMSERAMHEEADGVARFGLAWWQKKKRMRQKSLPPAPEEEMTIFTSKFSTERQIAAEARFRHKLAQARKQVDLKERAGEKREKFNEYMYSPQHEKLDERTRQAAARRLYEDARQREKIVEEKRKEKEKEEEEELAIIKATSMHTRVGKERLQEVVDRLYSSATLSFVASHQDIIATDRSCVSVQSSTANLSEHAHRFLHDLDAHSPGATARTHDDDRSIVTATHLGSEGSYRPRFNYRGALTRSPQDDGCTFSPELCEASRRLAKTTSRRGNVVARLSSSNTSKKDELVRQAAAREKASMRATPEVSPRSKELVQQRLPSDESVFSRLTRRTPPRVKSVPPDPPEEPVKKKNLISKESKKIARRLGYGGKGIEDTIRRLAGRSRGLRGGRKARATDGDDCDDNDDEPAEGDDGFVTYSNDHRRFPVAHRAGHTPQRAGQVHTHSHSHSHSQSGISSSPHVAPSPLSPHPGSRKTNDSSVFTQVV